MRRRPNWFDWILYRIYCWRWNPILADNPVMREVVIEHIKAAVRFAPQDRIRVTVLIEEPMEDADG